MNRKLTLSIASILAVISGCTLDDPIVVGDSCPPKQYVLDVCDSDTCKDSNPGYICQLESNGTCAPILDENNNLIYPDIDANNNYSHNGVNLFRFSQYQAAMIDGEQPKLSFIQGRCQSAEDCTDVGYGYNIQRSVCPEKESLCEINNKNQFFCTVPVMQCSGEDVSSCKQVISNWVSGRCENNICIVDECSEGYMPSSDKKSCSSSCGAGQHYDNNAQSCVSDDIENCGATGYNCTKNVSNWVDGNCETGICKVSECADGYLPSTDGTSCVSNCRTGQHYDSGLQSCSDDDIFNCGATGYICSEKVAQWMDGLCIDGVCTVLDCQTGYKVQDNQCNSDCSSGEHYDSEFGKCVADDIDNCGMTGYVCKNEIKNSSAVECSNGKCVVTECNSGYTVANNTCASNCTSDEYYDSTAAKCETNSLTNCGMKGYTCSEKVDKWKNGTCNAGNCTLSECQTGFKVVDNTCKADCGSEQHYNTSTSQCENNDLNNCGAVGYKCSDKVAQWSDGSCIAGVCTISKCESGYKVVNNNCASDCKTGEHYDSDNAQCVADDINNCGATGRVCKDEIKNSKAVTCDSGKCIVSSCTDGYKVLNNVCTSDCSSSQYYDSTIGKCVSSNTENCGQKGYNCSTIDNWISGTCTNNSCILNQCNTGYKVVNNTCKADCGSEQHYNTSTSQCENNDLNNCGATGYKCSDKVAQWADGSCVAGVCTLSQCENGYKIVGNACKSDCKTGEHYDSDKAQCVSDDINNCGATNHVCKDEIKNSKTVTCDSGKCMVSACTDGYKVLNNVCTSDCTSSQYYDSTTGKCVPSDMNNCGQKGYSCANSISEWNEGTCTNNACVLSKCNSGYKVVNNTCKADCGTEQHYNTSTSQCENNDLNNCGAVGYKCSDKVAQWSDGSCVAGVCTISKCNSGYKVVNNTCASDCKTGEHYDSDKAQCVADDINNCGSTGHVCKDEIKNSKTVSCESGKCVVSACSDGYKVLNNVCTSDCSSSQYYDSASGKCVNSDIKNCGQKGYACSTIDNWSSGTCTNNSCILTQCNTGYKVVNNTCKADCGSEQHYNTSTSQCENNDLNNCGATGYKCSEKVAQWADGSCIAGVCTLSQCESGYKVVKNACASDCKSGEHYDSNEARCVVDDINNCGATDRKCSEEIKNSKTVTCVSGKCVVSACSDGYKVLNNVCTSDCTSSQYYDSSTGKCAASNTNNCGQKDYKCAEHVSNWNSGTCTSNVCSVSTCNDGYAVINNECKADCGTTKYYDSATGECVSSNINNCGQKGYKCSAQVTNWLDGSCTANVCLLASCASGYKPSSDGKQCVSDCKTGQHYDSNKAQCVSDDNDNCGATGHKCSEEIKNSKTVSCNSGKCSVSACNTGYTVNNNTCVSSCSNTQYYDVTCKTSDVNNCGQKGYSCASHISNWATGKCTNNSCVVTTCSDGYAVKNNECKADCGTTKYYDSSTATCITSDIGNCGQKGYQCASQVSHWADGTCSANICKVTTCAKGYKPSSDGKSCISDCTTNQHYDSSTGGCVTDDVNNCGATGHKCSEEIKNSKTVNCSEGKCSVSACNTGYTINNNTCVSSCSPNQYYDVTCKASDVNNCGQKGYTCATHIPNWASGNCYYNSCIISTCKSGFAVINNECKASCGTNQYYHNESGTCLTSDANNCGMSGYSCANTVGWANGSCSNNQCVATSCTTNYHLSSGKCVADTNTCCGSSCTNCANSNQMCTSGVCSTSCQGGTDLCKGSCINKSATHVSSCTSTSLTCASGYSDCNGEVGDGCETYINGDDGSNCGTCNKNCSTGYFCKSGSCTSKCTATQKLCHDACLATSMYSSSFHVTGTGTSCKCLTNYVNTNGDWADGCENSTGSSITNCAGTDCTALLGWSAGTCSSGHCNATACTSAYTLNTSSGYGVCQKSIAMEGCVTSYPLLCPDETYCCTALKYCTSASSSSNCRLALKLIDDPIIPIE